MKAATILAVLVILTFGHPAAAQTAQTPLDITGPFNIDAVCGPAEYRMCLNDGLQDLGELFGGLPEGNGTYVMGQSVWMVGNGYGAGLNYSIVTTAGHPIYLSGSDGLPADGVIAGADRLYHMASLVGNATMPGNWTETADPSDFSLLPNAVTIGALHNKADWQITDVTVELPASQKGIYETINFVLAAQDAAQRARYMQIVALYGPTGADEVILYSFATDAANGPVMDEAAPAGFATVLSMTKWYSGPTGTTGVVRAANTWLFEFDTAFALDNTKTLWGFRVEDTNPAQNWQARGLTIFAATATRLNDGLAIPTADAGPDQTIVDDNEDGLEDVQLDGSASADSDGVLLTHVWTEGATLARGIAPIVSLALGSHTITLTVTDEDGLTDADTVQIDVDPLPPGAPVADAGPDQSLADTTDSGDTLVTLDGSGSLDPDGTIVSWEWTEGDAPIATGETAQITLAVGIHNITLTVTDNDARTRTDTVSITVKAYTAPMTYYVATDGDDANAGTEAEPFATVGHAVSLASYGDTIILREGIYREGVVAPTSGYDGSPITLKAADGEHVVISGAKEVTGWASAIGVDTGSNPNAASIYYADVDWKPANLYEDNTPLTKARTPGYWVPTADGSATLLIDAANLTQPSGYWTGADIFLWITAGTAHYSAVVTDHTGSTLTFGPALTYGRIASTEDHYYLQNKVELIGGAGQWAVEDIGGGAYRIFVWPSDDADPSTHLIEGSSEPGGFLFGWGRESYWVIDGIEFRHNESHAVGSWTSGAASHITIRNCMLHHNGGTGIYGRYNDYGVYTNNYVGHNSMGISTSDSVGVLIANNEVDHNDTDGIVVNGDDVTLRRNYIHGHKSMGHADNAQTFGDVDNLLFEENLILDSGQSIMMAETTDVVYRGNVIAGSHAYMVIAGHASVFGVTLEGNTLMFAGLGLINASGEDFHFSDNIFMHGYAGGVWGMTDGQTFTSDYNLFYTADGFAEATVHYDGLWNRTLASYVAASGEDTHSVYANPGFTNAPVSYHMVEELRVDEFTPTRIYMRDMTGLAIGDHIEIDWDGVVRTVTAVGADYIEYDIPKPLVVSFKANAVNNWKTNTDFTLDLSLATGSAGIGLAAGGGDVGSPISVPDFRSADFDGDGAMDIPRWGAAATPPAKPGDADGDGDVDLDDFVILKSNFGASPLIDDRADFDGDGDVDLDDFVILKSNFGT